jgi:hypothetical protein
MHLRILSDNRRQRTPSMITNSRLKMSLDWSTLIGLGGQEWRERKPLSSEDDVKRCVRIWTRIGSVLSVLS